MDVQNILHMVGGEGATSYAINSTVQKTIMIMAKPYLENTIIDLFCKKLPKQLTIADLGCSSGPNALLPTSEIIDVIYATCQKLGRPSPEVQVFLNDLPGNDFNSVFKIVPSFYEKLRVDKRDNFGSCFIAGVPGSFHGKLFPSQSLCFVNSSTSLHWLSQVPRGIEGNKRNIYLARSSPPNVFKSYLNQFQKDFSVFLNARSSEVVPGGRMVLTMAGRRSLECYAKECCYIWEILAESLSDMVSQGFVEEAKLESFNIPIYTPNGVELREIIEMEGSFNLDLMETFDVNWDTNVDPERKDFVFDKITSGRNVANFMRALMESMIVNHFGEAIIEDLFHRCAEYVGEHLEKENAKNVSILMCLTKKE